MTTTKVSTKKMKMKAGFTTMASDNTQTIVAFFRAVRPTRTLLAATTREYLKDYPIRKLRVKGTT